MNTAKAKIQMRHDFDQLKYENKTIYDEGSILVTVQEGFVQIEVWLQLKKYVRLFSFNHLFTNLLY